MLVLWRVDVQGLHENSRGRLQGEPSSQGAKAARDGTQAAAEAANESAAEAATQAAAEAATTSTATQGSASAISKSTEAKAEGETIEITHSSKEATGATAC